MSTTNHAQAVVFTRKNLDLCKLTRRQLLKRSLGAGGSILLGSGFIAGNGAAWAMEVQALKPETMATLVQMARDIFPHDQFGDNVYAAAVKGHDDKAAEDDDYKMMIENGVAKLNALAKFDGHQDYVSTGWEADRVEILKIMESDGFFKTIRGGLVVGLYNQEEVWGMLGYEGSSFEHGGYLNRGFDDIDWL